MSLWDAGQKKELYEELFSMSFHGRTRGFQDDLRLVMNPESPLVAIQRAIDLVRTPRND